MGTVLVLVENFIVVTKFTNITMDHSHLAQILSTNVQWILLFLLSKEFASTHAFKTRQDVYSCAPSIIITVDKI